MSKNIELKNDYTLITLNDGTRITIEQNKDLKINQISVCHHNTPIDNTVEVTEVSKRKSFEKSIWTIVKSRFVNEKNKDHGAKTIVSHIAFEQ